MTKLLLLPDTIDLEAVVLPGGWQRELYSAGESLPVSATHADALALWGASDAEVSALAQQLPVLRWVQALSAGTDAVTSAGFPERAIITSGRGLHDATVSEHALALVLAAVRSLPAASAAQRDHRWATNIGGMQSEERSAPLRSLNGANVLIWGFGSIGTTLACHLKALGAEVTGVARSSGIRDGFDVVNVADLATVLPSTDLLIMILPSNESTAHALSAGLLALLPARAWVVNVGRGSTIDESSLIDALSGGSLAGAALDVFTQEPLEAESPLWDLPNVIITPHAAGGRPRGAAGLISRNLALLEQGRVLENTVTR